jgi:hypothetical protein
MPLAGPRQLAFKNLQQLPFASFKTFQYPSF